MTREEWNRYIGDLADYRATCHHYPPAEQRFERRRTRNSVDGARAHQ